MNDYALQRKPSADTKESERAFDNSNENDLRFTIYDTYNERDTVAW
jgi:hypothetical protein